jgi:hypothetical protein
VCVLLKLELNLCVCARPFAQVIWSLKPNLVDLLFWLVIWSFYTILIHLLLKNFITCNLSQISCISAKAMSNFFDTLHLSVQATGPFRQASGPFRLDYCKQSQIIASFRSIHLHYLKQAQIIASFGQIQTHFISNMISSISTIFSQTQALANRLHNFQHNY